MRFSYIAAVSGLSENPAKSDFGLFETGITQEVIWISPLAAQPLVEELIKWCRLTDGVVLNVLPYGKSQTQKLKMVRLLLQLC